MTDQPETPSAEASCIPGNAAFARCYQAYERERSALVESGRNEVGAHIDARGFYRRAIPLLTSSENIRDFISCVAYGILIDVIDERVGARLLYAAQVARSALPPEPRQKKTTHPLPPSTVSSPQIGEQTAQASASELWNHNPAASVSLSAPQL
jgi:hypothetical protein